MKSFAPTLVVAGTVAASTIDVVHIFEHLHVQVPSITDKEARGVPDGNDIFKRQDADECSSSLTDIIDDIPTLAPEVESWLTDNEPTNPCSWTIPASHSEEVMAFFTGLAEFVFEKQDDISDLTENCHEHVEGEDTGDDILADACPTAGSLVFVDERNATTVEDLWPIVQEAGENARNGDDDESGAGLGSVLNMITATAAVGFAGLVALA